MMKKVVAVLGVVGAAVVSGVAAAQTAASAIDVSAVTGTLTNQITPIGLVGGGVLILVAILAAYKFVRRAA